jgi:hypothetical protein
MGRFTNQFSSNLVKDEAIFCAFERELNLARNLAADDMSFAKQATVLASNGVEFCVAQRFALTKGQGTTDQATVQQANTVMTQVVEYDSIVRGSAEKIAAKIAERSHDDPCIGRCGTLFWGRRYDTQKHT